MPPGFLLFETGFAHLPPCRHFLSERLLRRSRFGEIFWNDRREQFYSMQSEQFVQNTFHGSFPAFLAAFSRNRPLTEAERELVRQMIDGAEVET